MASDNVTKIAEALQIVRNAGYYVSYNPDEGEFGDMGLSETEKIVDDSKKKERIKENTKLTSQETLSRSGYTDVFIYLQDVLAGKCHSIACCMFLCDVESDGYCHHGHPSIERLIGMI